MDRSLKHCLYFSVKVPKLSEPASTRRGLWRISDFLKPFSTKTIWQALGGRGLKAILLKSAVLGGYYANRSTPLSPPPPLLQKSPSTIRGWTWSIIPVVLQLWGLLREWARLPSGRMELRGLILLGLKLKIDRQVCKMHDGDLFH